MKEILHSLLAKISQHNLGRKANVITWASPVPVFGKPYISRVGTLGLNPSNREFVDLTGQELSGPDRRFHTLRSLGLKNWHFTQDLHIEKIAESCEQYFSVNPYNNWFQELDVIINALSSSYYGNGAFDACHLDLIPFATSCKWTELSEAQRQLLLEISGDFFAHILRDSPISILILNGMSVIRQFEAISNVDFLVKEMPAWTLSRKNSAGVKGLSYQGVASKIGEVQLGRDILIIGFNHNIQSSFGVTKEVKASIREWIGKIGKEAII